MSISAPSLAVSAYADAPPLELFTSLLGLVLRCSVDLGWSISPDPTTHRWVWVGIGGVTAETAAFSTQAPSLRATPAACEGDAIDWSIVSSRRGVSGGP